MNKKSNWIKIAAILAGIAGVAVAVGVFLKKKSEKISEELDFDNSTYFDDEDSMLNETIEDDDTQTVEDFEREAEEIVDNYSYDILNEDEEDSELA